MRQLQSSNQRVLQQQQSAFEPACTPACAPIRCAVALLDVVLQSSSHHVCLYVQPPYPTWTIPSSHLGRQQTSTPAKRNKHPLGSEVSQPEPRTPGETLPTTTWNVKALCRFEPSGPGIFKPIGTDQICQFFETSFDQVSGDSSGFPTGFER